MDFVAIDFETDEAGLPWQLGAAAFKDGELAATRDWRFTDGNVWAEWADIYAFLQGKTLVAHNIACEKTILTKVAPITAWGPWVDTLKLARKRYPKMASYELGALCAVFGCVPDWEGRTWHDGLYDAIACGRLYAKIG